MRDYLPDTVFDSLRTWAEVDLCALERNFDKVRARQPENVGVCAVIKADAYGHGSVEVAKALEGKAALFAVAMTDEGVQLRQNGINTPGHISCIMCHPLLSRPRGQARASFHYSPSKSMRTIRIPMNPSPSFANRRNKAGTDGSFRSV